MEKWKVFKDSKTGKELAAYTLRGTFPGEEQGTIELLAGECGIDPARIEVTVEERKRPV